MSHKHAFYFPNSIERKQLPRNRGQPSTPHNAGPFTDNIVNVFIKKAFSFGITVPNVDKKVKTG